MKANPAVMASAIAFALAASTFYSPRADGALSANATAFCQGALPSFDTQIRKRPLAVANEGDAFAFVSCSIPVGDNAVPSYQGRISVTNRGVTSVDVSCTLVDGLSESVSGRVPGYYPKTITVPSNSGGVFLWSAVTPGPPFDRFQNFSCSLPPGVELNEIGNAIPPMPGR